MTINWILFVCGASVIACGLVSGVFLAFSDFVMKSLVTASPMSGIEAMQIINRKVYGSVFLTLFMGMAPVSLLMAGYAYFRVSGPAQAWIIIGAALYLIGAFLVTMVFNVPMNQRLDAMDLSAPETVAYWAKYARHWTFWNHVRTLASVGATLCFLVGCVLL